MTQPAPGWIQAEGLDEALVHRLTTVCAQFASDRPDQPADRPTVVLVGVGSEEQAGAVRRLRAAWPAALLVCVVDSVDALVWRRAQRGGADVVVNPGAAARVLRQRLASWGDGGRRRFALVQSADAAGRLGLVTTLAETPWGPLALFRSEGRYTALADRCPHAGATLSEGALDGSVLTCPRHGSQFDVTSGERLRGPADDAVRCWAVLDEGGQLWISGD